ncbi:MAG: hypothetical protein JW789_01730 [Candidatus Aenigmarchaeota archaeon]|nr:hypothetical protein [Candidatus Aenigmarchaeota archaeon]
MNRRSFVKTIAAGTAGMMVPEYLAGTERDWAHGVYKGTVPIDIYCCDIDIPPRTRIRSLAESYEGPFREDLLEETDFGKKYDVSFIEKFADQLSGYISYLSSGDFNIKLNNADVIPALRNPIYDEVTTIPRDGSFRMIITTMMDNVCGEYFPGGLLFVNPFNVQLDRDNNKYFDPTPIHEMFHGLFRFDHIHSYFNGKSLMYPTDSKSSVGLSRREFRILDWKPVEPIDVHPLKYNEKKDGSLRVRRT